MASPKSTNLANLAKSAAAPRCGYHKMNGQTCAAPALRGKDWCLFHAGEFEGVITPRLPEDAATIQLNLARTIYRIESGELTAKQASLILYALQIASMNLKRLGAELPLSPRTDEELLASLFRQLDPLPDRAASAWSALRSLIIRAHGLDDDSAHTLPGDTV